MSALPLPKLLRIEVLTPNPYLRKMNDPSWGGSDKYWVLLSFYHAKFHTDQGVYDLMLWPGWVTDKRSGSSAIDWFIPKDGCEEYRACVFAHDTAYSGWLSQYLADNLFVRQGFYKSKQVSKRRAAVAYRAVRIFGKAYDSSAPMPKPYTTNRRYEHLALEAK